MLFRVFIGFGLFFALLQSACAHGSRGILRGEDLQTVPFEALIQSVPQGSILVIGENHGVPAHRDQQVQILEALRERGHKVSVGLEFLSYPHQPFVDSWRQSLLSEEEFLQKIQWQGTPFEFYRKQAEFPLLVEGSLTLALNAPRSLTSRIAKVGIAGLTTEEAALLPPDFTLGRDSYRRRFEALMPHLPDGPQKHQYFAAQSAWDDTMAWRASEFHRQFPTQTLVIVVGDFHVRYGGGLPDRLRSRSQAIVKTLSQLNTEDLSLEEIEQELSPSLGDGSRADWIWADEGRVP